jgi:hypothetical protein
MACDVYPDANTQGRVIASSRLPKTTRAGDASSHGGLTVMSALFALGQIVATPGGPPVSAN